MNIEHLTLSVLHNLPQVIIIADYRLEPTTGQADLFIEYVNPAWEKISGAQSSIITNKFISQTIYNKSSIPWVVIAQSVIEKPQTLPQTLFSELLSKWIQIHVQVLHNKLLCFQLSDVTELKNGELRLKKQNNRLSSLSAELQSSKANLKTKLEKIENLNNNLEKLAYFDHLTGLLNRTHFTNLITQELERSHVEEKRFALAIFDIDDLKTINDTAGHECGDELLTQVADRLQHFEHRSISFCRFGGDEFLVAIKNCITDAQALQAASNIQEILTEPYMLFSCEMKISVSVGISISPDNALTIPNLLKCADIAMTEGKQKGKNTITIFHPQMQEKLLSRITLEKKMINALEHSLFSLNYQPQFNVEDGLLTGFEALIRWTDDELGIIPPAQFIPIAEENRLIISLGDWILRTACATLKEWQDKFSYTGTLAVNVSPIQLQCTTFLDDLCDIIQRTQIEPNSLELEITEGVLISNFDQSIGTLEKIREMGIGISLDDFGTGYSSLSYLQRLPLSTLKIDKSFISNIAIEGSMEYDIAEAIVSLVDKFGLNTIAEGVETNEQLQAVREIQCKTVQGFLTGKPMKKADCEKIFGTQLTEKKKIRAFQGIVQ